MKLRLLWLTLALGSIGLGLAQTAQATLGEPASSVETVRVALQAQSAVSRQPLYSVYTLTTSTGDTVREYVSLQGSVFAVSWSGSGHPDMQLLLGSYFASFRQGLQTPAGAHSRASLSVNLPNLVVKVNGHMGALDGLAYLPQQLPTLVQIGDLQ